MFKEETQKTDIDYENDFKVVVASNATNGGNTKVHQLKSLDSFSRSSESLALSVTSIGENTKPEKERRKKKTRSASRGKKEEREPSDYVVSRDTGESFISGILANVRREGWSIMGESEEERLRLLNMRLEGKLSVTNQASEEALREQAQLRCNLEIALKEVEGRTKRLESLEIEHNKWSTERESINERNAELEKRVAMLLSDVDMKISESEKIKQHLQSYQETFKFHEENLITFKDDVAMKETIINDLKKKMSELYSQLQLVKLYHENSEYQVEQVRLELDMAKNARAWVDEQLRTVENVRDQLQAEVQRVRKSLDDSKAERDNLDHKNQSLELKLAKLQDARLHETTQLLFELEQLQKEIISSGEEKDSLEERYASITAVYDEKVRELDEERIRSLDLEKQYDELAQELSYTKDNLSRTLEEMELLEAEASDLRKNVASLNVLLTQKVDEIRLLETENTTLEKSLRDWRTQAEGKDTRIGDLGEDLTNVRNSLERVSAERDQSTMFIAQLRDDCEKVAEQFEISRQALLAKEDALKLMEDMAEEMRVQLELGKTEIEASHAIIEDLQAQKDKVAESCAQLQSSHSLVCQELDNLRQSLANAHLTMAGMEEEIAKLTTINGRLTEAGEHNELQLAQLKAGLLEAQQRIEDLSEVQGLYADLLYRHQRVEAQLAELANEHQSLKLNFDWTTKDLEARLEERDTELARLVSVKEEVEQVCHRDRLAMEQTHSMLRDDLENTKFAHVVELATKESKYREQLEQSERDFSQMCQEKIRCEAAIGSLQAHINSLVDDYNGRLKECRTKMLSLEEKSTAYADYEAKSRQLMAELARKKGEIEGMLEEWRKMKMHAAALETALARREANVVEMAELNRVALAEKDNIIDELSAALKKERDFLEMEGSAKSALQKQTETQAAAIDSLSRQMRTCEQRADAVITELENRKRSEQSLLDENQVLRESDRQIRMELERRYNENLDLMRFNQQLSEQLEIAKIAGDGAKRSLREIQEEAERRSRRVDEGKKKQEKLVQRHKQEKKELKYSIKDVQQEKETLTRAVELTQQREIVATSVLLRLRSEVKRILFEEEMSSKTRDSSGKLTIDQFQELQKLLHESDVPMKTSKPLSRLSKCIDDLRTQIDSMQEDVFKQLNDEPVSEMSK